MKLERHRAARQSGLGGLDPAARDCRELAAECAARVVPTLGRGSPRGSPGCVVHGTTRRCWATGTGSTTTSTATQTLRQGSLSASKQTRGLACLACLARRSRPAKILGLLSAGVGEEQSRLSGLGPRRPSAPDHHHLTPTTSHLCFCSATPLPHDPRMMPHCCLTLEPVTATECTPSATINTLGTSRVPAGFHLLCEGPQPGSCPGYHSLQVQQSLHTVYPFQL